MYIEHNEEFDQYYSFVDRSESMKQHGILGMHWGIRRFQNKDGSLTPAGRKRYQNDSKFAEEYDKGERRKKYAEYNSAKDLKNIYEKHHQNGQYKRRNATLKKMYSEVRNMDEYKEYSKLHKDITDITQEAKDSGVGYTVINEAVIKRYNELDKAVIKKGMEIFRKYEDKLASDVLKDLGYEDTEEGREYLKKNKFNKWNTDIHELNEYFDKLDSKSQKPKNENETYEESVQRRMEITGVSKKVAEDQLKREIESRNKRNGKSEGEYEDEEIQRRMKTKGISESEAEDELIREAREERKRQGKESILDRWTEKIEEANKRNGKSEGEYEDEEIQRRMKTKGISESEAEDELIREAREERKRQGKESILDRWTEKIEEANKRKEERKAAGYTAKNKVKSKLGIYEEGDGNPYVSERRRQIRKVEHESYEKGVASERERERTRNQKKAEQLKKRGYSVEEIAKKLGVPAGTVSSYLY